MLRFNTLLFVLATCVAASADPEANLFWKHPFGDTVTTPCAHMEKKHPNGCQTPCTCPPVVQHPGGDDKKVPCVHLKLAHPDGHDTGRKVPCVHPTSTGPRHKNGDPVIEPCTHSVVEHGDGDSVKNPCVHIEAKHPDGEPGTNVPCLHLKAKHPEGDRQTVPCTHPLKKYRSVNNPPMDFYFSDEDLQETFIASANRLKELGVKFKWIKPLACFYREPVNGDPDDGEDPFWSHYDPVIHGLVVTKDPKDYEVSGDGTDEENRAKRLEQKKDTLRHELGHSLMSMKCVLITTKGGSHQMEKESAPGTAMSEGWANFVAAVLQNERDAKKAYRKSFEIENAADNDSPKNQKVEYRVTAILWDLYDTHSGSREKWDKASIEFKDLFAVFSPSLETLAAGPLVKDLNGYLDRLKKNTGKDAEIDDVVSGNGL